MPSSKKPPHLDHLIDLIRTLDSDQNRGLMEGLKAQNPLLAQALMDALFQFDDLQYLTDRSMQVLLKEIDRKLLIRALKQASDVVMQLILKNLSKRASESLLEEIDLLPRMRLSEVKEAQRAIAKQARSMEEAGTIILIRPNDDDPLV